MPSHWKHNDLQLELFIGFIARQFGQVWNVGLNIVELHMRQSKLQFDSIRVVNTQPLAQTLNLIQIYIDQHATLVCSRWIEPAGRSKLIRTNSVESNLELTYHELNSVSSVCLIWSAAFVLGLRQLIIIDQFVWLSADQIQGVQHSPRFNCWWKTTFCPTLITRQLDAPHRSRNCCIGCILDVQGVAQHMM